MVYEHQDARFSGRANTIFGLACKSNYFTARLVFWQPPSEWKNPEIKSIIDFKKKKNATSNHENIVYLFWREK
jgi:hypothetical protein